MADHSAQLLTPAEMYEADRLTIASGISGLALMENAGRAVADAICCRWKQRTAAILCGPGNNGGDGFVIARLLAERGWEITLYSLGNIASLKGDAAQMAKLWVGSVQPLVSLNLQSIDLVVDALFGAGLSRVLDGAAAQAVKNVTESNVPVVAVDIPSGVDGCSGAATGQALLAELTVTFFRKKPGHLLYPGRACCGETIVADIEIDANILDAIQPQAAENCPDVWFSHFPQLKMDGHKYHRGHLVAVSGPANKTGAARLAAMGALRAGAGLVTVASPSDALPENAANLTAIMLRSIDGAAELTELLKDTRLNAVVIGPGLGANIKTRELVVAAIRSSAALVIDADGLSAFQEDPEMLFSEIATRRNLPTILTPHTGEFNRLFSGLSKKAESKPEVARAAAKMSCAVVILKGADTVIASPDGRYVINTNAPPNLATAGSGDVLAGICAGLLAQGMSGFSAACAAVWMHGDAATRFGTGLIAEDLPALLPEVLASLTVGGTP